MLYCEYVNNATLQDIDHEKGYILDNLKDHKMEVLKDEGVYRHIRFRRPDSVFHWFDLITWPGCLAINGDFGSYSFSRVPDMFTFFRDDQLRINPSYYAEKLLGATTYKKFSLAAFIRKVDDYIEMAFEGEDQKLKKEVQDDVADEIFYYAEDFGQERAYDLVYNYSYDDGTRCGWQFVDFFDGGGSEEYQYDYLWNLYAIVWGIQQYDKGVNHD